MEVQQCYRDGLVGWQAGSQGKCFLGTTAKARAMEQLKTLNLKDNQIQVSKGMTYEVPKKKRKKRTVKKEINND